MVVDRVMPHDMVIFILMIFVVLLGGGLLLTLVVRKILRMVFHKNVGKKEGGLVAIESAIDHEGKVLAKGLSKGVTISKDIMHKADELAHHPENAGKAAANIRKIMYKGVTIAKRIDDPAHQPETEVPTPVDEPSAPVPVPVPAPAPAVEMTAVAPAPSAAGVPPDFVGFEEEKKPVFLGALSKIGAWGSGVITAPIGAVANLFTGDDAAEAADKAAEEAYAAAAAREAAKEAESGALKV
jgi:hypothetical protein